MLPLTVTQAELASILDISTRQLRNLAKIFIETEGTGRSLVYPLGPSVRAYIAHRVGSSRMPAPPAGAEIDPSSLSGQERLALAKAELAEYDLAEKRAETLTVTDAERLMADLLTPMRNELLALEARLRPQLGPEPASVCGTEIKRCLRDISKRLDRSDN